METFSGKSCCAPCVSWAEGEAFRGPGLWRGARLLLQLQGGSSDWLPARCQCWLSASALSRAHTVFFPCWVFSCWAKASEQHPTETFQPPYFFAFIFFAPSYVLQRSWPSIKASHTMGSCAKGLFRKEQRSRFGEGCSVQGEFLPGD